MVRLSRICCFYHLDKFITVENFISVPVKRFDFGLSIISARLSNLDPQVQVLKYFLI